MKYLILLMTILGIVFQTSAQTEEVPSPIIFIYDASGSMWGQMEGKTKMEIASEVLSTSINDRPENQQIGFVPYGHRKKGDCTDVEFLVDVENGTKAEMNQALKSIKPLGKTPLAYAAEQVIAKLRQTNLKATIILITDGIESCGGNICDVIKAAKSEGIDFRLHIIGFGLKEVDTEQLQCAAKAGDGNYFDTSNASELSGVLDTVSSTTIDEPNPNISIYALKNKMPIDAWVRAYDSKGRIKPIVMRTYQDTAFAYFPPSTYNVEVRPLGGSDVDMVTVSDVQSFEDKTVHRTISFDGGKLNITTTNNGENWDCLVKLIGPHEKVVATQRTYSSTQEVEVNPGNYKVTIQALASMEGVETYIEIESVTIKAGDVTRISHDFETGAFEILTKVGAENIDTVIRIKETASGKQVAASRTYDRGTKFLLNPGTYSVEATPLGIYKDKDLKVITVIIVQGEHLTKELKF